jgi:hypothetical protein
MNPVVYQTKRVARLTAGFGLIIVGSVLMIPGVPGPGFIPFLIGLSLLAAEFAWARRLRDRLKQAAEKVAGKFRGKPADKL